MFHVFCAYYNASYDNHARKGAEMMWEILQKIVLKNIFLFSRVGCFTLEFYRVLIVSILEKSPAGVNNAAGLSLKFKIYLFMISGVVHVSFIFLFTQSVR